MELLAVVQAETEADRILAEANARKEQLIAQAKKDREARMAAIVAPQPKQPKAKQPNAPVQTIKDAARRNRAKAVKIILEELYG